MQLFEKLIEYSEAERLVLENTPRLPIQEAPLEGDSGARAGAEPYSYGRLSTVR